MDPQPFKRRDETPILYGSDTGQICRNRKSEDGPPKDFLSPDIFAETSEEEEERQLDRPECRIEEDDHDKRSFLISLGQGDESRSGLFNARWNVHYFIHVGGEDLPYDGRGDDKTQGRQHKIIVNEQFLEASQTCHETQAAADNRESNSSPYETLSSGQYETVWAQGISDFNERGRQVAAL